MLVPTFNIITPALMLLLLASPASASTGMPWEDFLQQLVDSFAGPVARSILILAIVMLGFSLAWLEGPMIRRVLGVILGGAIAATAVSFGANFFGLSQGATF